MRLFRVSMCTFLCMFRSIRGCARSCVFVRLVCLFAVKFFYVCVGSVYVCGFENVC